ncbi:hypothetical protein PC129_g18053 [Phytophthora cactorum]|uniref:Uncharacterized protein n=1 Tax=Phytophthora cactorum TaxID=29920 RepID=A0A8T0YNA2_9STRA|nr:hypothetical protein Pcac1_g6449 [Phytophthora cactorum]KAG2815413.1 hypothetical protein PC112_g13883 [Phytophthora cactorum]KAG2817202.1 hypothetical protein PC111_g12789 [Phytophthora cactorum]KAG2853404.1 hypothetical protein PC113_g14193 [Phytophthora cactorum]KAG2896362.1 hypothetical protein PC114_g15105 [Phytophthora cactorum]
MCVAHHSKVYNTQAIKLILRSKELGLHHFNPDRFEHAKRRCLRLSEPEGPVPKSQVQLDQKLEAQLERRGLAMDALTTMELTTDYQSPVDV